MSGKNEVLLPIQITFRGVPPSDSIARAIREKAEKLEEFYDRIIGCHVIVEAPHRRHRKGTLYHLRIDLIVPGAEIVVRRDPPQHHEHEDIYVAIRDAFDDARRQLQDLRQRREGRPRQQEVSPHGRVVRLFPDAGYGFLENVEGEEIYFHRSSVRDRGFDRLKVGDEVRFAEESGLLGPQASTVEVVGKQRELRLLTRARTAQRN